MFHISPKIYRFLKKGDSVFMDCGMHCIDCPVSRMESIEEACEVHGVDPDELIENLKDYFEHKNDNK